MITVRHLVILFLMSAACLSHAVEIIAHRGYSSKAPENTVPAFQMAWEQQADACELDLYLTTDHQIVVIHDKDTKRVAGTKIDIAGSTLADLTKLDVGAWKDARFTGTRIPTLQEALATLPVGNKRFFLEIKCGAEVVPYLQAILEPLRTRANQLVIIAFGREAAAKTKSAMPWLKVYRLASAKDKNKKPTDLTQLIEDTKTDQLDGLNLGKDWAWSEALVQPIRAAGMGLYVWTINDAALARQLAALGVDGITTDDPVLIRKALAQP